ncbi:hypothetical protein [Myxococcus stipitatus]|uniref:hypothetical protein n=1 Tax=Myxococcus stipitatus TaxID=83455 RepID=UPI0030CD9F29
MHLLKVPSILAVSAVLCFSAGCSKRGSQSKGAESQASTQPAPSSSSSPTAQAAPPSGTSSSSKSQGKPQSVADENCPMTVPGATAKAEDVPEGVALTLNTPEPTQVPEIQQRSRRMLHEQATATQRRASSTNATPMQEAQREDLGNSQFEEQDGLDETGMGGAGMAGAPTMPASASVQDTPDGVVIVYTALDPKKQKELSSEIHMAADQMQHGKCPGMGGPSPSMK